MSSERDRKLLKILLHAYPDRVTVRRVNDPARGVMVGGRGVVLEPASVVRASPLFLSLDPRDAPGNAASGGGGTEARVSLASAIEAPWLGEVFPHLLERKITHRFDSERGRVLSLQQTVFAGLVVREDIVGPQADPEGASAVLFEALRDRLRQNAADFLAADEEAARWLARARFLGRQMPELGLPAFDLPDLEQTLREACLGQTALGPILAHGLRQRLESRLTWKQRAALDEYAPETIQVPSGSRIRLTFPEAGSPTLAVRLQELFGLAETPRIAAGRVPVVLHLLGPNFRPVQVTSDLKSFWNGAYGEVRRDLRARYPKHPWPEDPWNAPPTAVGRGRKPR
jgi:ATP-dependent helicase HrpB